MSKFSTRSQICCSSVAMLCFGYQGLRRELMRTCDSRKNEACPSGHHLVRFPDTLNWPKDKRMIRDGERPMVLEISRRWR
jgi:hypothetical protein